MDSSVVSGYSFEDEDGKTYKVPGKKDFPDGKRKVLSCTIVVKALVQSDEDDSEGGSVVEIDCGALGTYSGFLSDAAWKSTDSFLSCLRKGCKGLPAIFCKFSQADLQDYGDGLTERFILEAQSSGQTVLRKRVVRLGRQSDSKTVIFGPEEAFRAGLSGNYERVDLSSTVYVWIPNSIPELSIPDEIPLEFDAVMFLSSIMPEKTLLAFTINLEYLRGTAPGTVLGLLSNQTSTSSVLNHRT